MKAEQPVVAVIGDLLVDIVVRPEVRLDRDAVRGSDARATIVLRDGGGAAHVAAWLARESARVLFVGRVGDDDAGSGLVTRLAAFAEPHVTRDPDAATGMVVALVDPDGERTMLTDRGASGRLVAGDLPDAAFVRGGHLHLSGYVLLDDTSRDAGLTAIARARAAGASVSVSAGTADPLRAAGAATFLDWVSGCDLLFANVAEAAVLTGGAPAAGGTAGDAAAALRTAGGGPAVVVTAGGAGAAYADADRVVQRPAAAASVTDTTGAGDACCAGFLAAWLAGADAAAALDRGLHLAAEAVVRPGGRPDAG